MNRLVQYIRGYVRVTITGAYPQQLLNLLTGSRIPFWRLQWLDRLTVVFCVLKKDLPQLKQLVIVSQCDLKTEKMGFPKKIRSFFTRPILLFWIMLTVLTVVWLPRYLLHYQVEGNEIVPADQILHGLETLGIGFGTYGPEIKPRWIKDHMLNLLPELQWITITQNGCLATVTVRERPEVETPIDRRGYAHVIATHDGQILTQSILAGQALHKPGDIVLKGELLVSGLVDLERVFVMEYAQAEVFARTWRKKTAVTPDQCLVQQDPIKTTCSVWLELGKKRIKIFGNSGISTASCDKMINRKILSLPGGLELPISLLIECCTIRQTSVCTLDPETANAQLLDYVRRVAIADMQAGSIEAEQADYSQAVGRYQLESVLTCREMIADTVEAKWNEKDYQYDGKNG